MACTSYPAAALAAFLLVTLDSPLAFGQEHWTPPESSSIPRAGNSQASSAGVYPEEPTLVGRAPGAPRGLASVCMEQTTACHVPESLVRTVLRLKESDLPIVAGQLALRYDPEALEFLDVTAGRACDASSPFVVSFAEKVDKKLGTIFLAVSVDPLSIGNGTTDTAALACLTFRALDARSTTIGLVRGMSPADTILSDPDGDAVNIRLDADCSRDPTGMYISATTVKVTRNCTCASGPVDCSVYNTQCTTGVCHPVVGVCQPEPINDNRPCSDGADCTVMDTCQSGVCVGLRLNCPSLCLAAEKACASAGDLTLVRVQLGRSLTHVAAGQFSVQYDPAESELVSIVPGVRCDPTSPFSFRTHELKSAAKGEVHYGVSVNPFDLSKATRGPATVACLTFRALSDSPGDICLYDGEGARSLRLSDRIGNSVPISNAGACDSPQPYPVMACTSSCRDIPAASTWGLAVLTLAVLTIGKVVFRGSGRRGEDRVRRLRTFGK